MNGQSEGTSLARSDEQATASRPSRAPSSSRPSWRCSDASAFWQRRQDLARRGFGPAGGPRPRGCPGRRAWPRRGASSLFSSRRADSPAGSAAPGRQTSRSRAPRSSSSSWARSTFPPCSSPAPCWPPLVLARRALRSRRHPPAGRDGARSQPERCQRLGYGIAMRMQLAAQAGVRRRGRRRLRRGLGHRPPGCGRLSTDKSRELVATLTVTTTLILAWLAWALLRPPRGHVSSTSASGGTQTGASSRPPGSDSLAYFALRGTRRTSSPRTPRHSSPTAPSPA